MDEREYVEGISEIRSFLGSDEDEKCTCPKVKCEWYGKCYECVRIHRHYGCHVPSCLQFILKSKIKEIVKAVEVDAEFNIKTPDELWDYISKGAMPDK